MPILGMFALLPPVLRLQVSLTTLTLIEVTMKRLYATVAMKSFNGKFAWTKQMRQGMELCLKVPLGTLAVFEVTLQRFYVTGAMKLFIGMFAWTRQRRHNLCAAGPHARRGGCVNSSASSSRASRSRRSRRAPPSPAWGRRS